MEIQFKVAQSLSNHLFHKKLIDHQLRDIQLFAIKILLKVDLKNSS